MSLSGAAPVKIPSSLVICQPTGFIGGMQRPGTSPMVPEISTMVLRMVCFLAPVPLLFAPLYSPRRPTSLLQFNLFPNLFTLLITRSLPPAAIIALLLHSTVHVSYHKDMP